MSGVLLTTDSLLAWRESVKHKMDRAVKFQNELAELMLEMAQEQEYLTAKDPDATPRYAEIVVTRDSDGSSTYHPLDNSAGEIRIRHADLLTWVGGDKIDDTHWQYRLRPDTIRALTEDDAYQRIVQTTLAPLTRARLERERAMFPHVDNEWITYQLEQVS